MYHKAMAMGDTHAAERILVTKDLKEVKQIGKKVKNYDEEKWSKIRYDIMKNGLLLKIKDRPNLQKMLLDTGDKLIGEASQWDHIWGIGFKGTDTGARHISSWGQNLLGKAWMEVRSMVRDY